MAELIEPGGIEILDCCSPEQQSKCCAPSEKSDCCTSESSGCGCSVDGKVGET